MPPLLEAVARTCSPEVFLLTVIAICFGTAYLTALAGCRVSLGAFLAGLVVSESRASAHAFGEVLPLQILFSADVLRLGRDAARRRLPARATCRWCSAPWPLVLVVKAVTTAARPGAAGRRRRAARRRCCSPRSASSPSSSSALGGEGADARPGSARTARRPSSPSTVLLMVATPLLSAGRRARLDARLARAGVPRRRPGRPRRAAAAPTSGHVVISGWGGAARAACRATLRAARRAARRHDAEPRRRRRGEAAGRASCAATRQGAGAASRRRRPRPARRHRRRRAGAGRAGGIGRTRDQPGARSSCARWATRDEAVLDELSVSGVDKVVDRDALQPPGAPAPCWPSWPS